MLIDVIVCNQVQTIIKCGRSSSFSPKKLIDSIKTE